MNVMDVTSTNVKFGPRKDPSTQVILPDTISSSKLPSVACSLQWVRCPLTPTLQVITNAWRRFQRRGAI